MNAFIVFLRKEWLEQLRSYRLLILAAVFILFGILGPATARFTPELLEMLGNGIEIVLPPVTIVDSYVQFFKNMNSIQIIVLLLMFSGMVADEKTKGSASLILTKNLSRANFLLAKYAGAVCLWTVVYLAGALTFLFYTFFLFPGESVDRVLVSLGAYWVFGLVILAITLFASAVMPGHGLATLVAFAGWGLLLLSMLPDKIAKVSPAVLGSSNLLLITGAADSSNLIWPLVVALALIGILLSLAVRIMGNQEM